MKILRISLAMVLTSIALLLIMSGCSSQPSAVVPGQPASGGVSSSGDANPVFTRYITVEVEAGAPNADSLWSRWQHATVQIPTEPGTPQIITLPRDSQDITATISDGHTSIQGNVITFTYSGTADTYYAYRTAQKIQHVGDEYRIDLSAYSNRYFWVISLVSFPSPYQYSRSITYTPQIVTTSTLQWSYIAPRMGQNRNEFDASAWLIDPRVSQSAPTPKP